MATITGFTAARMLAMEAATIVDGDVVGDNLILTRHDAATINAGSVRGPTGSPGITEVNFNAAMVIAAPVGMIIDYISVTPPSGWLAMTGQTIVGGQTLHPALWAVIPAGMKSGANIVMPNTKGRVTVGYDSGDTDFDAIGDSGGAKTHALSTAELPSHYHNINPPNTGVSISDPGHNHSQNAHSHSVSDGGHNHSQNMHTHTQDPHQHEPIQAGGSRFVIQDVGGSSGVQSTPGPYILTDAIQTDTRTPEIFGTIASNNASTTGVSVVANTATNNASGTGVTASVDITPFDSGAVGSNGAHNNLQPYVTFLKIIKAV